MNEFDIILIFRNITSCQHKNKMVVNVSTKKRLKIPSRHGLWPWNTRDVFFS